MVSAEGSRIPVRTFGIVMSTMSEQKFVRVKISINDQSYADTKVAEKDYRSSNQSWTTCSRDSKWSLGVEEDCFVPLRRSASKYGSLIFKRLQV